MKRKNIIFVKAALLIGFFAVSPVRSELPPEINFQGRLLESAGGPAGATEGLPEYPYIYPNPYRTDSRNEYNSDYLTFTNLPGDIEEIKILNLAGEKMNTIKEAPVGGKIKWDPQNRAGRRLASGVYIYLIQTKEGDSITGKFSIIY